MAKKDSQMDEGIIDLTELIEPGTAGGRAAAAAYARASTAQAPPLDDDFEAALAQAAAPPPADGHKVDPNESLDMSGMGGIDNLLESLDIPPQPRESAAPARPESGALDSVLDDLLAPEEQPKKSEPQAKPQPKPAPADEDFDLDTLLEEEPAPVAPAPAAKKSELDADLDDILASFDEPAPQPKAPEKPQEPVREKPAAVELDAILEEPPAVPAPKKAPPAAEPVADLDDLLDDLEPPAPPKAAPPKAAPPPPPADEMDDLLADLGDAPAAGAAQAAPSSGNNASQDFSAGPGGARPPAPSRATLPAEMPEAEAVQNLPAQAWPADMITGLCQGIASAQSAGDRETLQEFSRELGAQSAHVQDMGGQLSQLGKRLLACESKLAAARARIASLEKGLEAAAALEDLLREGTPLHTGFMGLIAAAVGNALKGFTPQAPSDALTRALEDKFATRFKELENRLAGIEKAAAVQEQAASVSEQLEKLDARIWNVDARIEAIEKKVEALTQNFGKEMDKAASGAVAKILQEEISKLLQE